MYRAGRARFTRAGVGRVSWWPSCSTAPPPAEAAQGNGNGSSAAGTWLGLHQESDGTLRALATLTALYQDVPLSYAGPLSLEEPENALHPGALAVLADAIREAATRRQIILTTQSPNLITWCRADDLRAPLP